MKQLPRDLYLAFFMVFVLVSYNDYTHYFNAGKLGDFEIEGALFTTSQSGKLKGTTVEDSVSTGSQYELLNMATGTSKTNMSDYQLIKDLVISCRLKRVVESYTLIDHLLDSKNISLLRHDRLHVTS